MMNEVIARSDPQIHALTCCFGCNDKTFKNLSAVSRHLSSCHADRFDFPVLKLPYDDDVTGSTAIGQHVLKEIDFLIFMKLKLISFSGRAVPAFKRIHLKIACPPGAFYFILQSASVKARWTAAGNLIVDHATGETIKNLLGTISLEREFISYKAIIDPLAEIKMRLVASMAKDRHGNGRKELYFLKICLIARSQRRRAPMNASFSRVML